MSNVVYTASKLAAGKKGILPPDADGYYVMPVGALNVFNSVGQYYVLEGAKDLFDKSSIFQRRIANGCLKGELGHPKRAPGMSMDDYLTRILSIEETNVCCHFRKIWLDYDFGKNNPQFKNPGMVAIMAEVKPSGPKGDSLKQSFDNPHENVCFSIRSLTRDYYERGQCYRVLQQIVGFDAVTEPGLALATMWSAPALESVQETLVTKRNVQSVLAATPEFAAMESTLEMANESLAVFNMAAKKVPLINKW
jgi:hypothetical protein